MGSSQHTTPPEATRLVADFLRARPGVLAAYVFGSRASGVPRATSDLDVAVLLEPEKREQSSPLASHEQLAGWQDELCRLVGLPVDLIDLGRAGLVLTHEVLSRGFKLFETDLARVRLFEARALIAYLDFRPLEERFARAALRAVRQAARW